jgi:hypothetical protein
MAYLYLRDEKLFYKVYSQWSYELCLYPDLERDPLFKAVIDLIVTCVHVSYVIKIHVHIDWLTVFKHPLTNISYSAGQEYFISWVDLAFYWYGNVFDPPPVHTSFLLKTLKLVITASLLIIIKACIMK